MRYLRVTPQPPNVVITLLSHILKLGLLGELRQALAALHVERIVITGEQGFFAAGADIAELSALDGPAAVEYARFGQTVCNAIRRHKAITIAAIDGYCMGGGLDLALACDLRYATAKSVLAHPGGRIGIMTGWGGTRRLPFLIGKTRALEMMAMGRRLSAAEAWQWGLVTAVVDDPVAHGLTAPD